MDPWWLWRDFWMISTEIAHHPYLLEVSCNEKTANTWPHHLQQLNGSQYNPLGSEIKRQAECSWKVSKCSPNLSRINQNEFKENILLAEETPCRAFPWTSPQMKLRFKKNIHKTHQKLLNRIGRLPSRSGFLQILFFAASTNSNI